RSCASWASPTTPARSWAACPRWRTIRSPSAAAWFAPCFAARGTQGAVAAASGTWGRELADPPLKGTGREREGVSDHVRPYPRRRRAVRAPGRPDEVHARHAQPARAHVGGPPAGVSAGGEGAEGVDVALRVADPGDEEGGAVGRDLRAGDLAVEGRVEHAQPF